MKAFSSKKILGLVGLGIIVFFIIKSIYFALPQRSDCEGNYSFPHDDDRTIPTVISSDIKKYNIPLKQHDGLLNDASCLNATAVYGVVKVTSPDDIKNALRFARDHKVKISIAGKRHSMGGHTFIKDGLVLDMNAFNHIELNKENKSVHVQAGGTWSEIQKFLDPLGLSMKAMQSINIFSVGGTLSVNAHGIAHSPGCIAPTVESLRVMLADGSIVTASLYENTDLFKHVLGGYGLFGVILDVDIQVTNNEMYAWKTDYVDYKDFLAYYKAHIEHNDTIGLVYARLSVSPHTYLRETAIHVYTKIPYEGEIPPLQDNNFAWLSRFGVNFSKVGPIGRFVRWMYEKYLEPRFHMCSRNQAMGKSKDECLVSRNQEMYDSMEYLENRLQDTDILQEYFIPHKNMSLFVDGLRSIVRKNKANLLNVTIRMVEKDCITSLPYAKEPMFAFVLYFNQRLNDYESTIVQKTTVDLIDLALSLQGTFYLPYQLFYSQEQLHKAYPEIDSFFAAKRKYDPQGIFSNTWYAKYGQQKL